MSLAPVHHIQRTRPSLRLSSAPPDEPNGCSPRPSSRACTPSVSRETSRICGRWGPSGRPWRSGGPPGSGLARATAPRCGHDGGRGRPGGPGEQRENRGRAAARVPLRACGSPGLFGWRVEGEVAAGRGPTARCRDEGERGKAFGRARCGPSGVLGLMGTRMGWAGMFHVKHRGFAERRAGCRGMAASPGSDQKGRGGEREQRGKDGGEPREAIGPGGHDGTRGGRGAADARGSVGGGSSGSAGAASGASRRRGRPRR